MTMSDHDQRRSMMGFTATVNLGAAGVDPGGRS